MLAAAAGALATALLGGIATAAIPDDGGVIHGCYLKVAGGLRVIDTAKGQKCLSALEVGVDWNQKGQAGAPGAPGQPGEKGDQGLQGIQGLQGQQGLQGLPGEPGQDGVSGYEIVMSTIIPFPPGINSMRSLLCPEGKRALGGGVSAGVNGVVTASFPLDVPPFEPGQLWAGGVKNTSATASTDTQLWVICATVE